MIDDEADYASVNTRPVGTGDDEDPTVINGRIRELLNTFEQRVYVGYTATPFANHLHLSRPRDRRTRTGPVSPRLPGEPPGAQQSRGPTKVFGLPEDPDDDEEQRDPLPLVRIVDDHHEHIPDRHLAGHRVDALPGSLHEALRAFILTCAARSARGGGVHHNSMLIHVTRFVGVQSSIADLVRDELRDLQNRIRYGDGDSAVTIMDELRTLWSNDFASTSSENEGAISGPDPGVRGSVLGGGLPEAGDSSQSIQVRVIQRLRPGGAGLLGSPGWNERNRHRRDKLSRGLTLEGLSVSYYLRTSRNVRHPATDGRWFGYRPGYVDLCRLYTSEELRDSYEHITMATAELREEFDQMAARGMSPREFGLRVRSHPAGLMITAAGKMRNGTRMTVSYSGDISETISFDRDPMVNRRNHGRFEAFIRSSGTGAGRHTSRNHVWHEVAGGRIADLMEELTVHPGFAQGARRSSGEIHSEGRTAGRALRRLDRGVNIQSGGENGGTGRPVCPTGSSDGASRRPPGCGNGLSHPPSGQPDGRDDRPDRRPAWAGLWI